MKAAATTAGIGPFMGILLVATTMIGSGVFLLPATLATVGTISVLGWLIAAAGALLIGLTLGFLCRLSQQGFIDAIGAGLGPWAGQTAGLLYLCAYPLVNAAVAVAAAGNIGFLFPELAAQPRAGWLAVLLLGLLVALVQSGVGWVARFGSVTLLVGLAPILLVATAGWARFDPQIFRAGWNMTDVSDVSALFQATLLCFWAFLGLEAASVISRRMRDPVRSVPIATVGGILLAAVIYISASAAVAGLLPAATLARSTAPFADATRLFLGPVAAILVAVAAGTKALGTLGASQLGGTETWLGVQRQLGIPGLSYSRANLVTGTLAATVVLVTASPTLATQYGLIISAVVVLTLLAFAFAAATVIRTRRGGPRAVAGAALLFCLGLVAVQPPTILLLALGATVAIALPLRLFARRRAAPI